MESPASVKDESSSKKELAQNNKPEGKDMRALIMSLRGLGEKSSESHQVDNTVEMDNNNFKSRLFYYKQYVDKVRA